MMTIRPLARGDSVRIAALHRRTWKETYTGLLPDEAVERGSDQYRSPRTWSAMTSARANGKHLDTQVFTAWIGESKAHEEMCGFAVVGATRSGHAGEVFMLYVAASAKRQGIGRALMDASARHAIERGFFALDVCVLEANTAAHGFYEKLGGSLETQELWRSCGGVRSHVRRYRWPDASVLLLAEEAGK